VLNNKWLQYVVIVHCCFAVWVYTHPELCPRSQSWSGTETSDGICHCLWYETKCLLVVSRYLESQIQEGAGKEIRCPGHDCFKVVPNVSAWLNGYVVGNVTIIPF